MNKKSSFSYILLIFSSIYLLFSIYIFTMKPESKILEGEIIKKNLILKVFNINYEEINMIFDNNLFIFNINEIENKLNNLMEPRNTTINQIFRSILILSRFKIIDTVIFKKNGGNFTVNGKEFNKQIGSFNNICFRLLVNN